MAPSKKKEIGTGFITETDRYLFGEGTHYEIYEKLGAHPKKYRRKEGMYFAVWAPHAQSVSVVGDFNDWNPDATPMEVLDTSGIYEVFVPGLGTGQLYKYALTTTSGKVLFKSLMHLRQNIAQALPPLRLIFLGLSGRTIPGCTSERVQTF